MTHDQEQLIIDPLEADIKKHSVDAVNPTVQVWAGGRVEDGKKALEAFRETLGFLKKHK
jgi:FAD/FMN-containing dehydrogenase